MSLKESLGHHAVCDDKSSFLGFHIELTKIHQEAWILACFLERLSGYFFLQILTFLKGEKLHFLQVKYLKVFRSLKIKHY